MPLCADARTGRKSGREKARAMDIIPVIDLKGGEVVRAERGARDSYAPIKTRLASTSRPADVVAGFLALHDFPNLYIADLDAIEGRGSHQEAVLALEEAFTQMNFWVDTGVGDRKAAESVLAAGRSALVLGSESLRDIAPLTGLAQNPRILLSLDFRGEDFQGPPKLLADTALWPSCVIVMTLARVGSHEGLDLDRLGEIVGKADGAHRVYAAGGLRGPEDLASLAAIGVEGVLVASALHDGRLDSKALGQWMR